MFITDYISQQGMDLKQPRHQQHLSHGSVMSKPNPSLSQAWHVLVSYAYRASTGVPYRTSLAVKGPWSRRCAVEAGQASLRAYWHGDDVYLHPRKLLAGPGHQVTAWAIYVLRGQGPARTRMDSAKL